MQPPVADWADVVDLDYSRPGLEEWMIEALKYWVREFDIDGYRCDVAGMVPLSFWEKVRPELDKIKPVFMLAECDDHVLHENSFDMSYSWNMFKCFNEIAAGRLSALAIDSVLAAENKEFRAGSILMRFTSNHDENSWNGTVRERLGRFTSTYAVLSCCLPGMPLVYGGQEAGLDHRLKFFDKDVIPWKEHKLTELYSRLLNLKLNNSALWHGSAAGEFSRLHGSNDESIYAFARHSTDDAIIVILNLSPDSAQTSISAEILAGQWTELFSGESYNLETSLKLNLEPAAYRVLVRKNQ
jgi:cyclomaltodextrinase / maltogenic alpha-amylase / neopullulanase